MKSSKQRIRELELATEEWNQIKVSWSLWDRGVEPDQGELELGGPRSGTRSR